MNKYHQKTMKASGYASGLTKQQANQEAARMEKTANKSQTEKIEDSSKSEMRSDARKLRTAGNKWGRR